MGVEKQVPQIIFSPNFQNWAKHVQIQLNALYTWNYPILVNNVFNSKNWGNHVDLDLHVICPILKIGRKNNLRYLFLSNHA